MRSSTLLTLVVCLFAAFAAAWTKEDHEIFRVRDEVAKAEGYNVTFYDLLDVKSTASQDELNKAYRKKSARLHPDKARQAFIAQYQKEHKKKGKTPGVKVSKGPSKKEIDAHMKTVTAKYQRLSVIANILKGPERQRYDHFLKNGFPAWRGTGWYYQRFRPGLGSVLFGVLVVVGGGMHYFALLVGWKRRREFVERYIRHARKTAWGDESGLPGIPGIDNVPTPVNTESWDDKDKDSSEEFTPRNRREKRAMEKENRKGKKTQAARIARSNGISTPVEATLTSGPQGAKKRIVAENGKILIVDSVGNVFLEEETAEGVKAEFLLDPNEEPHPTIADTLLFKLPKYLYARSLGRILGTSSASPNDDEPLFGIASASNDEDTVLQNATAQNLNGEARKRKLKGRGGK